ncbi:MAG: hypothetical protein AAF264_07775 [Pseudomonadota bacterium]
MRALCVATTVLMPSLLLPGGAQATEGVVLLALFAGLFVLVEYGARSPSLVEFRAAPPINRVRFGILAATLLLLTLAVRVQAEPTTLSRLVAAVGLLAGHAIDLPLSPVRLVMGLLPEGISAAEANLVRAAAGLAYLASLAGLTVFAIVIRVCRWPSSAAAFNVWMNLPSFDSSGDTDVVRQLRRDGAVNILLGFLLPYLGPLAVYWLAGAHGLSIFDGPLLLVWTMSLWAFLPASLFLRGIAMRRLAAMISLRRRRIAALDGPADPAFLPV